MPRLARRTLSRLPLALVCTVAAFAQGRGPVRPLAEPPEPHFDTVDVVVTDAAGATLRDLKPADFQIAYDGKPKPVARFTAFDALRHTAASSTSEPALPLKPEQVHRTLVVVIDDLSLSLETIANARQALRELVTQLQPGDSVSVMRTSSTSGFANQLTSDRQRLLDTISDLAYIGGDLRPRTGAGVWSTLRYAFTGLQGIAGRKALVLIADLPPPPAKKTLDEIANLAHNAATVFYPFVETAETAALANATDGLTVRDFASVLRDQESYYALSFESDRYEFVLPQQLQVKLVGEGLHLRARAAPLSQPERGQFPMPREHTLQEREARQGPFAASAIRTQLTTLFSSPAEGGRIDALVHIDARDLTAVGDLSKNRHLSFTLGFAAYNENGEFGGIPARTYDFTLTDQEYRWALEFGLIESVHVTAVTASGFQLRALVSDAFSDRFGVAGRFVEAPAISKSGFTLSSLVLEGDVQKPEPNTREFWNSKESRAVREFPADRRVNFSYFVYNAAVGTGKQSEIETQTRVFADGSEVYSGARTPLILAPNADPVRRSINGKLSLAGGIGPGKYVLLVTVVDKLAPGHTASQYVEFTVVP